MLLCWKVFVTHISLSAQKSTILSPFSFPKWYGHCPSHSTTLTNPTIQVIHDHQTVPILTYSRIYLFSFTLLSLQGFKNYGVCTQLPYTVSPRQTSFTHIILPFPHPNATIALYHSSYNSTTPLLPRPASFIPNHTPYLIPPHTNSPLPFKFVSHKENRLNLPSLNTFTACTPPHVLYPNPNPRERESVVTGHDAPAEPGFCDALKEGNLNWSTVVYLCDVLR